MSRALAAPGRAARLRHPLRTEWILPLAVVVVLLAVIGTMRPDALSTMGLGLLFSSLLPLMIVSLSQMFVMAAGDVDLGVGAFVSLVNVVTVAILTRNPLLGTVILIGLVLAYGLMALLIYYRRVPAIVVTLGMSFVWLGLALTILPTPGGTAPGWLMAAVNLNFPVIPEVIALIVVITAVAEWGFMHTRYGAVLRGSGSNSFAVRKAGWSLPRAKVMLYLLAGLLAALAGLVLSGQTTSGDPNVGASYVLLSIAGVVIGGGTFAGGSVTPLGTAAGALAVGLLGVALGFVNISPNLQIGAEGLLLIAVVVARWAAGRIGRPRARLAGGSR